MNQLKPKQKDNCLFNDAERNLLANLHYVMSVAIKNKSKVERAGIMQAIGAVHQDLMIRWLTCSIVGKVR